ncbi:uncharacterized protein NESG_01759 [Nematocida ausubeli]|uniref:Uncharacterized protein n=1 Tax=Nematocida ausubeli (strain ATCC PRA-371 / ERTm2) TaxID=1913371 RepID=A0A086J0V7_NEMA1|nr:uncharacterized protein NESG_01759 [Nematocida ausubeli]KFG25775.1 hypothetical protein NESG_01759 [Nematocida ausubeli]
MRFKCLGLLLVVYQAYGRIPFEQIMVAQDEVILDAARGSLSINPEGPLSLLRGYIYNKTRLMYNKRFFSAGIKTEYKLAPQEKTKKTVGQIRRYNFTRTPKNDKSYLPESATNKYQSYISEYNRRLILMFPSVSGELSIESGKQDSFIEFLRSERVKENASYILAALLLLSENVDVPLTIEGKGKSVKEKKLVLRKFNGAGEYFNIEMKTPGSNAWMGENSSVVHNESRDIILFFIKNRRQTFLESKKILEEPKTLEEFNRGFFLNTPRFLIQTYIFEFIDKLEDALEFTNAVHAMLCDALQQESQRENAENPQLDEDMFRRFFIPATTNKHLSSVGIIKSVQKIMEISLDFPFTDDVQPPKYIRMKSYIRKLDKFDPTYMQKYSNCVETAILSIFCSLIYNPEIKKYETDHIEGASKDFKEFFRKHSKPFKEMTYEMHMHWSKVVSDLPCSKIVYLKNGNELDTGILNMMKVISVVVGQDQESIDTLDELTECVEKGRNLGHGFDTNIKNYIRKTFESLARNRQLSIQFTELKRESAENGNKELFGSINLKYIKNKMESQFNIEMLKGHARTSIITNSRAIETARLEQLINIRNKFFIKEDGFLDFLANHYLNYKIQSIERKMSSIKAMSEEVNQIMKGGFKDIDRILLYWQLEANEYKFNLVLCFLLALMDEKLTTKHPAVRFTSNIIGSAPLDNNCVHKDMLASLVYIDAYTECYPNLDLPPERYAEITVYTSRSFTVFKWILLNKKSPKYFIKALIVFITSKYGEMAPYNPLKFEGLSKQIFRCLFIENTTEYADEVVELVKKSKFMGSYDINILRHSWFAYACEEKEDLPELIYSIYDSLEITDHYSDLGSIQITDNYKKTNSVLRRMKKDLKSREGGKAKWKGIINFFNRRESKIKRLFRLNIKMFCC